MLVTSMKRGEEFAHGVMVLDSINRNRTALSPLERPVNFPILIPLPVHLQTASFSQRATPATE